MRLQSQKAPVGFVMPVCSSVRMYQVGSHWAKSDNNLRYLSTFYIVDSNICSSVIQKRVIAVRTCPYLIIVSRFAAKVIEQSGSTGCLPKGGQRSGDTIV